MRPVRDLTMGSIYQTKDGRYRAAITVGYDGKGRQVRRTVSAKTKPEVTRKRNELFLALQKSQTAPAAITLQTHAERWLQGHARAEFSPRNYRNHEGYIRNYIVPTLGAYKLTDIGLDEVRELDTAVVESGASGRTCQIVRSCLSVILKDAVARGLIDFNPCDRVPRPKSRGRKRRALSVEEARHLIVHSAKAGDPLASLWASFFMLGPRKGELLGLRSSALRETGEGLWADMSVSLAEVPWRHGGGCKCAEGVKAPACPTRELDCEPGYVVEELHGALVLAEQKTDSSRRLTPVPAPLDDVLRRQAAQVANPWGLLWVSEKGLPLRPGRALLRWKAALKAAGLPVVDIHTARHTAASLLAECGVAPQVIGVVLGQSQVDTTLGYVHVSQAQARLAVDAYAERLGLPTSYSEAPHVGDGFSL